MQQLMKTSIKALSLLLVSGLLSVISINVYANANDSSAEQRVEHVIIQDGSDQKAVVSSDLTIIQTGDAENKAVQTHSAFILMRGNHNEVYDLFKGRIEQSSK